MDQLEVTAKFDIKGKITLLYFTWKGSEYLVESTGRQWDASDGKHILVMVPDGRIFEVIYSPTDGRWLMGRVESGGMVT